MNALISVAPTRKYTQPRALDVTFSAQQLATVIMTMLKRLLCLVGRHERSAGRVHEDEDGAFRSVCRHCTCVLERDDATRLWWPVAKARRIKAARIASQAARPERRSRQRRRSDRRAS
jgi:hypothetical protein